MIILGIDTSTDYAVFVIADENGQCYGSAREKHERALSSRFYAMLDTALARSNIDFEQVDAFAVGLGPGSFTGVRVAVTTLRTLAQVTQKPLVGVPTMAVFASAAGRQQNPDSLVDPRPVAVLLPSRRNEVYAYIDNGTLPSAAYAASYAEALDRVRRLSSNSLVTGPLLLLDTLFGGEELPGVTLVPQDAPNELAFAELSARAIREGRLQDPLSLDPMYVAPPAVSQHKMKPAGP